MTSSIRRFAFCLAFLCAASSAYATTVAKVSCTSLDSESQISTLAFNVSYFDFAVTPAVNIGSQSGGAGAGKVTFQPLVVRTSLAQMQSLLAAVGTSLSSCTLTTTDSTGEAIEFTFGVVGVTEVDAIAHSTSASATAYTQATFEYGSIQVTPGS
jgi:hypothetical protein